MKLLGALVGAVLVSLIGAAGASADTIVNPFSGEWNTMLSFQNQSIPGTVKFTAISESDGISQIEAIGGHPCGAPTTFYHGDFTDNPDPSTTQTGTMALCVVTAGHLVGRWSGGGDEGNIDITLDSAQTGFDGSFTSDMFGITQGYSGTFVSHFPGDGCCTSGGGGGGGFFVTSLLPPTTFCPDVTPQAATTPPPPTKCATKKAVTTPQKDDARETLRLLTHVMVYICESVIEVPEEAGLYLIECRAALEWWAELHAIVKDPPSAAFRTPPPFGPLATAARSSCGRRIKRRKCGALKSAFNNLANALSTAATTTDDLALAANRLSGAVQANDPQSAFIQEAFAKVNAGVLAQDIAAVHAAGQALAAQLTKNHLGGSTGRRKLKLPPGAISTTTLNNLVADGFGPSASAVQQALMSELSQASGSANSSSLGATLSSSSDQSLYESITMSEVAAIVSASQQAGSISNATTQVLANDLATAQSGCANSSQRIAAINQFVSDARGGGGSAAAVLTFAAQPLLAVNLPAASCL